MADLADARRRRRADEDLAKGGPREGSRPAVATRKGGPRKGERDEAVKVRKGRGTQRGRMHSGRAYDRSLAIG